MRGRCAYLSLTVAAGATLLAGCGGGSSSTAVTGASGASGASGPSGATALTKGQFIKQADAVCGEANTAIADLSGGATTGDEATQVSQKLEIVRSEVQSLQALKAPSEGSSTIKDYLAALKNEVDALERENTAVASNGDTTAAESEFANAQANAEAAATDYGMKECGTAKARHTQAGVSTTAVPTTPTTTSPPVTTTPTTTTPVPSTVPTPPTTTATIQGAPPSGGNGGGTAGGTGGGTSGSGGGNGSGGTGGTGGVSP
jgi:hypothetical protein